MVYNSKVYDVITNKIIESLKEGVVPWHKPWDATLGLPKNLTSKKSYRGVNVFLLNAMPYDSPWWVTYKQVGKLGGRIKDEEIRKSTPIVFFKWNNVKPKYQPGPDNKEEEDNSDRMPVDKLKRKYPMIRYYRVYNVEQCTGLEEYIPEIKPQEYFNPIEECEAVIKNMPNRPKINHGGNKAYYEPRDDFIQMPPTWTFDNIEGYYSTEFHEIIHSTGHESRLKRKGIFDTHVFGDPKYSLEELVAEMGASYLCAMTGIENKTINNSASYIANWLDKLKNDQKLVVIAGSQAQKACDYVMNEERRYD